MPPVRTANPDNLPRGRVSTGKSNRRQEARDGLSTATLSLSTTNVMPKTRENPASDASHSSRSSTLFSEPSPSTRGTSECPTTESIAPVPFLDTITLCGIELRPTVAFDTFWRFAAERKAIDDRRRAGQSAPFTEDKILRDYFFCNTFRVLDKVSQYLIKEVIEKGPQDPEEVVFRVLLFNSYTKIETWELLDKEVGPLRWKTYDREKYRKVLADAVADGMTLYTGAFIKPAPHFGFKENYVNHLCLLESFMDNRLAFRLLPAPYMSNVYEYLASFPGMGPFSTYQLILCLSYTNVLNFHPDDFVISGPGSISGLNKLFGKSMNKGRASVDDFEIEVMRYMATTQHEHFRRLGLEFSGLGPKKLPMTLADIEHTLCEVDKYCRLAHPQLKGKRVHLRRDFRAPSEVIPCPAILPKAWSDPARRTARIRPEKALTVEKRYEVDYLKEHRDCPEGRQYLVFWVGYSAKDATWEFESSLMEDAATAVCEYFSRQKKQKK